MSKVKPSPATVLTALMGKYMLSPFSLSKAISLSNSAILQILKGKGKITVPTALRLEKFFGQTAVYWLDLQREMDLSEAAQNKELSSILKGITKVKMPKVQPKVKAPAKKPSKKTSLSDKRKPAAKASGAKPAKRKTSKKAKPN